MSLNTLVNEATLQFLPINLSLHLTTALSFMEDAYVCSFGHADLFNQQDYTGWLRAKTESDPWSAVHAWLGERIVGQMELGEFKGDPSAGYVNLYYLIPELRGKGLSHSLDEFALNELRKKGFRRAFLSVSPTNLRALRYYQRLGWVDCGPRPEAAHVHLMEKQI